ncbi:MAG TPA: FAD-dependent monooxygenase [Ramlibacter sp.]|nr:FAD-dependent monooxygenase [Ramlibacter sp.]
MIKIEKLRTVPVLVVGAGPVGLALAGDLGWRGIETLLVERGDGGVHQPKMDMVGIRTMEFCRRWGIIDWVHQAGYNRAYPQDCAWVSQLRGGWEFGREVFPSVQDEAKPPQSPEKRERCPQNFFDRVLTRFVQHSGKADLRYHTEYVSHEESDDGVLVQLRNVQTGAQETVHCQYLIATDGGASTVRHALDIPMAGIPALTYTTNAIFECAGLEQLHDKQRAYRYIFIGPEGTWATLVAINGRDQWRFSLVGDETMRAVSEQEVCDAFRRAVGRDDFSFKTLSVLPWVRRQLVADSYGTARVKIAGDAAHLTSPTGGFGMNMGIQDSVDLAWKLEAVLAGWGGPELLQSYEVERRPVAIRNVNEATSNLKLMLEPRKTLSPAVFEQGPAGDQARQVFGDAYTAAMRREWYSIGIHLGFRYEGSPVVCPDGTAEPDDTVSTYAQTSRPGHRAPHVWLSQDVSTLDSFGRGFVLVKTGAADPAPLLKAAAARGVPLTVVDWSGNEEARVAYERALVLVRPDGHVGWRGDKAPDDADAVFAAVTGHAGAGQAAKPAKLAEEHA